MFTYIYTNLSSSDSSQKSVDFFYFFFVLLKQKINRAENEQEKNVSRNERGKEAMRKNEREIQGVNVIALLSLFINISSEWDEKFSFFSFISTFEFIHKETLWAEISHRKDMKMLLP